MRLNRSTSHAIRILIDCAGAGDALVKVADLSQRLGITMQNVFKIVHILSRAGLVAAVRGRHGGVRLARPAGSIRIGDIVRAMEATALSPRAEGVAVPDHALSAGVNRVLDSALEAFTAILDRHTLAELASAPRRAKRSHSIGKAPRQKSRSIAALATGVRGEARKPAR
jgi:Rrf2 family nitric oxide-sensitive transcriptional repressor